MNSIHQHIWTLAAFAVMPLIPAVTIAEVWIEEIQPAELPLALLSNNKTKIVLKPNGNLGNGTSATLVGGTHIAGEYRISSDSNRPITINFTSDNSVANIVLKNFKARYNGTTYKTFPRSGLANPGLSGTNLTIGFTTVIGSGASEGGNELSYIIEVTEDQL